MNGVTTPINGLKVLKMGNWGEKTLLYGRYFIPFTTGLWAHAVAKLRSKLRWRAFPDSCGF